MKILVLSDSHGCTEYMEQAVRWEKPDCVIHLGDHAADAEQLQRLHPMMPMIRVRGNCDFSDFDEHESREAVYDGVRILAVHGHRYGVKSGLLRLFMAAKEKTVHVALFGHTHCAYCEKKDGIWLMNPGACGGFGRRSYGIVEIAGGSAQCRTVNWEERKQSHDFGN